MTARIEKAEIIEALRASAGIGTKAAEILGCTRQAISARIAADPELQEAQRNARQLITDVAESNIIRSITKGDLARSQWWLRTQERERFGDRVEAVGPNGGPLQIQSSVSLDWEKLPLEALIAIRNEAKNQRGGAAMLSDAEATNAISSYRASMDLVHPDSAARRARATPRDSNQSRRLCLTWAAHDAEAKLRALAKLCPLEAVTEVDRLFDLLPILEPAIGGRDLVAARTITTQAAIDFYRTDDLLKTERAAARARVQDAFTSSAAIITGRMTERLVAFRHEHKIYTVAEASRARTESKKGPALLPYLSSLREARKESLRPVARPFAPNTAPQVGP